MPAKKLELFKYKFDRYREHKTDIDVQTASKPFRIPCKVGLEYDLVWSVVLKFTNIQNCPCSSYTYIPLNGSQPLRCHCKHPADEHIASGNHACSRSGQSQ